MIAFACRGNSISEIAYLRRLTGDVELEREQLSKVINELNLTISAIAPEPRKIHRRQMLVELESSAVALTRFCRQNGYIRPARSREPPKAGAESSAEPESPSR